MNLEPVIQSKVSQKNKRCILMHIYICIYGILKSGIDEPICREGMETQTDNRLVYTREWERVGQAERAALKHAHHHM